MKHKGERKSCTIIHKKSSIIIASPRLASIGGIGIYIRNLATNLFHRRWSVHCIGTNERGDAFEQLAKEINCHDLSSMPLNLRKVFAAAKLVNRINPHILLLNNCSLMHYALPLLAPSIRPVVVIHSDDPRFYEVAALFSRRIFRWIAPTPGVAEGFRKYLSPDRWEAISVVSHGVSEERFHPVLTRRRTGPTLTFVGYIAENKGADLLPTIMQQVVDHCPYVQLNVVGYCPLTEPIRSEFNRLGLGEQVVFAGALPSEGVADVLGVSDLFLLPTRIEGFGLAIIEAMMCGAVPVVSRLVGVTDSIVKNYETGILVEVDDTKGFSSAIINLFSDADRLLSIKRAARKTAQDKFSLQRMIADYEQLFNENDNRAAHSKRGIAGWTYEVLRELLKKDPDGIYKLQKKIGTVKKMLKPVAGKNA